MTAYRDADAKTLFAMIVGRFICGIQYALDEGWRASPTAPVTKFGIISDPNETVRGSFLVVGKLAFLVGWMRS